MSGSWPLQLLRTLLVAALLLGAVKAHPQSQKLPPRLTASLLLRILAYDRRPLAEGADHRVAVVAGAKEAAAECDALAHALHEGSGGGAAGAPKVHAVRMEVAPTESLLERMQRAQLSALFLCGAASELGPAVAAAARSAQVLTFTDDRAGLDHGLAVGLVRRESRAGIVVALDAVAAQGSDLDADLLRLVELHERGGRR